MQPAIPFFKLRPAHTLFLWKELGRKNGFLICLLTASSTTICFVLGDFILGWDVGYLLTSEYPFQHNMHSRNSKQIPMDKPAGLANPTGQHILPRII